MDIDCIKQFISIYFSHNICRNTGVLGLTFIYLYIVKYLLQLLDKFADTPAKVSDSELRSILKEIKLTAFSLGTEQELRLFIQNHQIALHQYKVNVNIAQECDQILYLLESFFATHLNKKLTISNIGKKPLAEKTAVNYSIIAHNLTHELLSAIMPIFEISEITIHEADFLTTFWKDCSYTVTADLEKHLIEYLILYNYNDTKFYNYLISNIVKDIDNEDNPQLQEEILNSHSRSFVIIPQRIGKGFRAGFPSVKILIEDWIKEKIKQCHKRQKHYNPQQQSFIQKSKIETSLSVAETAYLSKLMYQQGIITNSVQSEMLQAIADAFKTPKAEKISIGSLHNKYYNVEEKTKETIREVLKQMLKQID